MADHARRRPARPQPDRLDRPSRRAAGRPCPLRLAQERFGVWSERFARFMGTAQFLIGMTVFVVAWLVWNTFAPPALQFDPRELNYTLLTLILSLQASYAAPLILLAQNRQADRDRVGSSRTAAATSATSPTPSTSPARWPRCGSPCATWRPGTSSAPSCATCSMSSSASGPSSAAARRTHRRVKLAAKHRRQVKAAAAATEEAVRRAMPPGDDTPAGPATSGDA